MHHAPDDFTILCTRCGEEYGDHLRDRMGGAPFCVGKVTRFRARLALDFKPPVSPVLYRKMQRTGQLAVGQGARKHPPAKVGDTFGPGGVLVVVALAPPIGHRSDECVRVRCLCGTEAVRAVYNLRTGATLRGHGDCARAAVEGFRRSDQAAAR